MIREFTESMLEDVAKSMGVRRQPMTESILVANPMGYSCKDNNQGNRPYPVAAEQLTDQQLKIMKAHTMLTALRKQVYETESLYRVLLGQCKHEVFWDTDDGFMYHHRSCVLCGVGLGTI